MNALAPPGRSRRAEAPAFLLSLLLNLGIVYGVATALQHTARVFERIEVDLRDTPPPATRLRPPPRASRPPEAPAAVALPQPAPVPQKISLARADARSPPRPSEAPVPLPVPAALPSPVAVPLSLARVGPPPPAPVTPEQASASPAPPFPPPPPAAAAARRAPGVLEAYYAQVRARIEAEKRYPRWARKARIEGRTTVGFRVGLDGALLECRISESSGHEALDRAALDAVERAAPFPAFPGGAGEMPETLTVVVAFVLE